MVTTHPIAGTRYIPLLPVMIRSKRLTWLSSKTQRKRGATEEEDNALAAELLADEKERAEHVRSYQSLDIQPSTIPFSYLPPLINIKGDACRFGEKRYK